ncbi:phosphotransferase [Lederbergia sp. NSJ-179]|uniref:phosphotransferase family protein n=1 Tax=Lederbergia sp. NSJ-179 TaxID=2931402 RepID=UPI001FD19151|nr:phosphotransferase [Lederbergia sp. NSJ-179]MCJ7843598.1 phosphotransferase [Lederbergia sp. NSJ-179]
MKREPIKFDEVPFEISDYVGVIKNIQFPRQGHTSDVGIIETENIMFVLKRTIGKQFCSWLSKEEVVLNCLSKTNLLTPNIYKFIEQKSATQSWILMEYIEGDTLRNYLFNETHQDKKHEIIYSFGKILSDIHSTVCPSELIYGTRWLDEMLIQAEYNLMNYNVDGSKDLLNSLKKNKPKPFEQTLIHGDFTIDNVLVKEGKITGIIDWSGGAYGDPRYDVSLAVRPKPGAFESDIEVGIFFEGYGKKIISDEEYRYFEAGLYSFF